MAVATRGPYCATCGRLIYLWEGARHCGRCERQRPAPTAAEAHAAMQRLLQEWPRTSSWQARWLEAHARWREVLV